MGARRFIYLVVSSLFAVALTASIAACGGDADDPTATVSPTDTTLAAASPTVEPFRTLTLQASLAPPVVTAGGLVTVRTDSGGSGIPQYSLSVDDVVVSVIRWDNVLVQQNPSDTVEVVSWEAGGSTAEWELRIHEPGDHTVSLFVSGEVGASAGGPFYFTHGTQRFQFMVTQPATRR